MPPAIVMVKFPNRVVIGPYHYEIRWVDESDIEELGVCVNSTLTLKVRKDNCEQQKRITLFHEILHACTYVTVEDRSVKLKEEEWVGRTSPTLFGVLRNNPEVRKYLFEGNYAAADHDRKYF